MPNKAKPSDDTINKEYLKQRYTERLTNKRICKIYLVNANKRKEGVTILLYNEVECNQKEDKRDKGRHIIMLKVIIISKNILLIFL